MNHLDIVRQLYSSLRSGSRNSRANPKLLNTNDGCIPENTKSHEFAKTIANSRATIGLKPRLNRRIGDLNCQPVQAGD